MQQPAIERSGSRGDRGLATGWRSRIGVVVLATLALGVSFPTKAVAWEWTLLPYLWASDITMDVALNGNEVIGADIEFSDLVDKLDGAASFHFEGRQGSAGFWLDLTLIALSDSTSATGEGPLPLPPDTKIDTDLDLTIFEAAGFYRLTGDEMPGFDLLGGLRYIGMDQAFEVTLPLPPAQPLKTGTDEGYLDGFLGFRYAGSTRREVVVAASRRLRLRRYGRHPERSSRYRLQLGQPAEVRSYPCLPVHGDRDRGDDRGWPPPDGSHDERPKLGFRITWGG